MFVGIVVVGLGMIAALIGLWQLNTQLHDQQSRTRHLVRQNAALIDRDTRTLTVVCKIATGLALNQPNLDPHFLRILNEVIGELPTRCFP